jgi:nucleotide-binding universal stress UspA family protein
VPGVAYRRILVPLAGETGAENALAVACRLAAEHRAQITGVTVIELPPELPLDAHMVEEEAQAKGLLERADAIAGRYGVAFAGRTLRAREAGMVIVDEADRVGADVVVLSAPRRQRPGSNRRAFGRTSGYVLRHASCRVMLLAPPAR